MTDCSFLNMKSNKSSISNHQTNVNKLIIILSLLMSGDIHPCPGPNGENFQVCTTSCIFNSAGNWSERNTAIEQVSLSNWGYFVSQKLG